MVSRADDCARVINMAGLPKKYAQMGFAKGWKAFRSAHHHGGGHSHAHTGGHMAKKHHHSGHGGHKKHHYFKSGGSEWEAIAYSALYGAARPYLNNLTAPIQGMIPATGYNDNLVNAGVAFIAERFIPNAMVKRAARTVIANEAFLAGAKFSSGMAGSASSGNPVTPAYSW